MLWSPDTLWAYYSLHIAILCISMGTQWALQLEVCFLPTTLIDQIVYLDGIILDILQRTVTMLIPNLSVYTSGNFSVSDRIRTWDLGITRDS